MPHNEDREIWVRKFDEDSAQEFRNKVIEYAERYSEDAIIPVYIDSYGGYVDSLAKMIETMDNVPNRFATIASGKAMSCGAILLSHGDIRWCGPYSRIMIHNIQGGTWGDAYDKQQSTHETMRMQKVFMGLLAKNCGITYKQLEEQIKSSMSSKEVWLDAESAIEFGITDHVGCPFFINTVQTLTTQNLNKVRLTDIEKGVENRHKKKITKKKATTKKTTRKKRSKS